MAKTEEATKFRGELLSMLEKQPHLWFSTAMVMLRMGVYDPNLQKRILHHLRMLVKEGYADVRQSPKSRGWYRFEEFKLREDRRVEPF